MRTKRTDKFRVDTMRIALTSRLSRQVASDFGIGLTTLNKWGTAHRDTDVVSDKKLDLARENERRTSPTGKGRVIGWAVSSRTKRNLAIRALKMAVALR
jgi:transposase